MYGLKLSPREEVAFPRSHGNLEKTRDRSQDILTALLGPVHWLMLFAPGIPSHANLSCSVAKPVLVKCN